MGAVARKIEDPSPRRGLPITTETVRDAVVTIAAAGYIAEHARSSDLVVGFMVWALLRQMDR
jgi:hypothetical protein